MQYISFRFLNSIWKTVMILILGFLASINVAFTQELPPIQSFTPQNYHGENQNWGITQGLDNHIYVANNQNLLEFDGVKWSSSDSPNASIFRSVAAKDSLIFTGQYMEFGYWKKNKFSGLSYTSISSRLKEPMLEDEEFWNIVILEDWILFQSLDRIYSYNIKSKVFKILNVKSTKAQIFKVNDTVYFQSQNLGIYKIENGEAILVLDHDTLKNQNVVGIYKDGSGLIVIFDDATFLKAQNNITIPYQIDASDKLKGLKIYCSKRLKDGSFVLGTISNGIYHITKTGEFIRNIDQRKGLNNNTVLSIYQDKDENLWLGLDNGIAVINMESQFKEYLDNLGRLGLVYTSKLYKEHLYLGTNQGLFVKNKNSDADFKMIPGTDGQVWSLDVISETLFCGHNNGTYVVDYDQAKLISTLPGTWGVKVLSKEDQVLIQGNYDGISILKKEDANWVFANKISGFETSSRFLEVLEDNEILVNNEYKGLFKLTIDDEFKNVIKTETHPIMGHGSSMVNFHNEILYTSLDGAFRKLKDTLAFTPDNTLNRLLFEKGRGINSILIPDEKSKRLWCFTNNGLSYIYADRFNASLNSNLIPIPEFFRRSLGVPGFENITYLDKNQYLIGISNGFVVLDTSRKKKDSYFVHINSIINTNDFRESKFMNLTSGQELESENNTFHFNYSVPEYDKYTEVTYQHRLKGFIDEWSEWNTNADISFNNLEFGDYTFEVKAKVGNSLTENVASYDFRINRPWYLSLIALAFYALGLILFFLSIHRLYKSYYTKKQKSILDLEKKKLKRKKLKTDKKLIQLKNEKLQSEIDSKNRELAISTMSIVKKNQFLNTIKEQLNKEEKTNNIKSIITTIDRNIENEDDWKFFEEAFNNADKDFLRTLQDKHSELTPNDLRLCAYLRLNLSSKEIAPLLNISIKSVEVKRYRLRKKMKLVHQEGLTDYILSL